MAQGFDFWRPPFDLDSMGSLGGPGDEVDKFGETFAPPERAAVIAPIAKSAKPHEDDLRAFYQRIGKPLRNQLLNELDASGPDDGLEIDDVVLKQTSCPVQIASAPSYFSRSIAAGSEATTCRNAVAALSEYRTTADVVPCAWRHLVHGCPRLPDPILCGKVKGVPVLPNPFIVVADVPRIIDEILADFPQEEWNSKKFVLPAPIEGFKDLYKGPGGLLPPHTPKSLAYNVLAAAIINRLCGNFLVTVSLVEKNGASANAMSPEARVLSAAKVALQTRTDDMHQAQSERKHADEQLAEFRSRYSANTKLQHQLESVVGWKSSAELQSQRDLDSARKELRSAEEALQRSSNQPQVLPWKLQWPPVAPTSVTDEQLFQVKLTSKTPSLSSVKEFLEAMESGVIDRSVSNGFIPKHNLEAAFVRYARDESMFCTCSSDVAEMAKVYTHLPAPAMIGAGFVFPGCSQEKWVPQPNHGFQLRLSGQTFPFDITLLPDRQSGALAFLGASAHMETYQVPWNTLENEAHDVLWAKETKECLDMLPAITAVAAMVADPTRVMGPFTPVPPVAEPLPLLGSAGVALMQAVLHNDVKMWPVCLPDAARVRWDFGFRAVRHILNGGHEEDYFDDSVKNTLTQCLDALPKVPHDVDSGSNSGCKGFGDKLKRMEFSALTKIPLKGATTLRTALSNMSQTWPRFSEDTDI